MEQDKIIEEIAIVISVRDYNPALLTIDFLKCSGVVPQNWELASSPYFSPEKAYVTFKNGISIGAEDNTITFSQAFKEETLAEVEISLIACKYISILPKLAYQGLGINPATFVTFEKDDKGAASNFIVGTFLAAGTWHELGNQPMKAAISLVYTLERCQFHLSIEEARLRLTNEEYMPSVLFKGSFFYRVIGETFEERLQHLQKLACNWRKDLETYRDVVNNKFIKDKILDK